MPQSNELRVFISSTFRDLQEEREHLIKKIFPEIRALCRDRGIRFTEVDLRWGVTDEQLALGQVIRTCLEEVDKCRPYFIGITGDRYGFIPTYLDIQKDPALLEQYPWIEDAAIDDMSITEMEAQYGVLDTRWRAGALEQARFYFRRHRESFEHDPAESEELRRLEEYQERIQSSGASIERFRDAASLGEMIFDDLVKIIKQDFADARPPTPLEEERMRHEAFSLSRRRAYIASPVYLKKLNEHAALETPPLVIYAESGSGKSSLFAFWAEQYRRKNPDTHVVEHYVGIGATSTDHYAIVRHVCMEINERFDRTDEIPSEPAKLDLAFGQWLGYADHELKKRGERMVLILDGLNQLQGTALGLKWIPDVIPPSIRLILSSTVEGTLVELKKRGWTQFGMQALSEAERETIVVRYLAEYHKSLNTDQIKRIAGDYKCGHPLFLKTVLEELRLIGRHEDLDRMIEMYLDTTGTEDLFQRMLERLEDDYSQRAVRDVMVLLCASRSSLEEPELSDISGLARLKIATMMAGLDYHLVRKEGRLTFFHDYLRRAVEKRYLSDEAKQRAIHLQIAEYFHRVVTASIAENGKVSRRMAGELAYQLRAGGALDRLRECLSTMPVFMVLFAGETQYEVLSYWSELAEGGDVEGSYRQGLERWRPEDSGERSDGLGRVADLLERLGQWDGALSLGRESLSSAITRGDASEEAASRLRIGWLLQLRGELAEALEELSRALALSTELGDRSGVSQAIGNVGNVHNNRGEYDQALESYERQLGIATELGDRNSVAHAIGNMGLVYYNRGEYDQALECFERKLSICEELGDRSGVSQAIGNVGNVHNNRGEYDRALESYERQLSICEELGDRRGVSYAIGNMGTIYSSRGEYDRALESYKRKLSICEELGDRSGISYAIGNIGALYSNRGENNRALESYERKLSICEELGDRRGVSQAIGSIGFVYYSRREYDRALESFERMLSICEELGDRSGISYAIGNMGLVCYGRREYDRALVCYERKLSICEELGDRSGISNAIGIMGVVYKNLEEYDRALESYERQLSICEELGDRSGIAGAIGNMGGVYINRGEYDRALESYERAAEEHRAIGDRYGLTYWLEGISRALIELVATAGKPRVAGQAEAPQGLNEEPGDMPTYLLLYVPGVTSRRWQAMSLRRAHECAEECVAISEELQKPDTLFGGRVLLARVEAAEGSGDVARERLNRMLGDAAEDDQRAKLHYWLWKLRATDRDHRSEALRIYQQLIEKTQEHEYKKRIEELTAVRIREEE